LEAHARISIAFAFIAFPAFAQTPANDVAYEVVCGIFAGESELIVCGNARLSDGTNQITAGNLDYAETQSTESGGKIWHLNDGVRVVVGDAVLEAESGTFEFDREELIFAELAGFPVTLSDYDADADMAFLGSADRILLDIANTTLSLLGRATLTRSVGDRESDNYEGCDWIYNWSNHSFSAGTPDCAVRLLLAPLRDDEGTDSQSVTP